MKRLQLIALVLSTALSAPTVVAQGELTIRIEQGNESALPIAVVPFAVVGDSSGSIDIAAVVRADLAQRPVRGHAAGRYAV